MKEKPTVPLMPHLDLSTQGGLQHGRSRPLSINIRCPGRRAVNLTQLRFDNVNYTLALRYIAKNAKSDNKVKEWGLQEWCPTRAKDRGPDLE